MWYNMNKFINWRRKDMNLTELVNGTKAYASPHHVMPDTISEASKEWYHNKNDRGPIVDYKFNEGNLISEFKEYVDATYDSHYSQNGFQSTEIIVERGHGTGFCMGNIDKYSNRYGKKGNHADQRKDLIKIMHYALIQLHIHDNNE
jgi:hypothetical protein